MGEGYLSATEQDRYARQLAVDGFDGADQQALQESAVLVVGAGGLGSAVLQYLAAAGIGRLGIIDPDTVDRSNLHRQVIHGTADLDRPKVESAAAFLTERNPTVTVETYQRRFDRSIAPELVDGYDVVVDASDNLPTRYLINDACTLADVPFVHGAVDQFEGQVMTVTSDGPCYRCLFPTAPPADTVPAAATVGVLGTVPGTIGTIQATEVLKLLTDTGTPLVGRLLYYGATSMSVETVTIAQDPGCPVCGSTPAIETVTDVTYEGDCAVPE